jgi:hypothetical protein
VADDDFPGAVHAPRLLRWSGRAGASLSLPPSLLPPSSFPLPSLSLPLSLSHSPSLDVRACVRACVRMYAHISGTPMGDLSASPTQGRRGSAGGGRGRGAGRTLREQARSPAGAPQSPRRPGGDGGGLPTRPDCTCEARRACRVRGSGVCRETHTHRCVPREPCGDGHQAACPRRDAPGLDAPDGGTASTRSGAMAGAP